MSTKEIQTLLRKLLDQTRAGQVKWKTTPEPDEFRINFPRSSIEIFPVKPNSVRIAIFNAEGTLIETIDPDSATRHVEMNELLRLAKDSAYNISETLQDIFDNLE
jgi:hypothetical protein